MDSFRKCGVPSLTVLAGLLCVAWPVRAQQAIAPCELLTDEQVATVLPNHEPGDVDHAGPSLIDGINAYQCSYLDEEVNMLTVVVNVASTDELFAEIKPTMWGDNDAQKISVGDGGWIRGEDDDMKVTVMKGRAVLDLELMAPGAKGKSAALVELAKAAAAHM
jgi:hypothetical protein